MRREVVWFFTLLWSMSVFAVDTEVSLYRPSTDAMEQSPAIIAKKAGHCVEQSKLIKREDAWRVWQRIKCMILALFSPIRLK